MFGKSVKEVEECSKSNPYDYLIVGAGSSGLTFAQTLASTGSRILIIEAGEFQLISLINNSGLRYSQSLVRSIRTQYSI
jgi:glycine/D-amino acid oxidase-like deaminating enzyme